MIMMKMFDKILTNACLGVQHFPKISSGVFFFLKDYLLIGYLPHLIQPI